MNDQTLTNSIDVLSQALKELSDLKNKKFSERFLDFHAEPGASNSGRGLIFTGQGPTKQLVYLSDPDRFFSSETIDLAKNKAVSIAGIKVLDSQELGATVVKSNLREVGRLKGLLVDGNVVIDNYLFYSTSSNRLGLGTNEANAAISVAEMGVEVMLGTTDDMHGMVGTYASTDFDIVTDNVTRLTVRANGNIELGNAGKSSSQVRVHGKLSIGVNNPDPAVDLHVAGAVKLNNKLHTYDNKAPIAGNYNVGDIVWNSEPKQQGYVGWICVRAGDPGVWHQFGEIR